MEFLCNSEGNKSKKCKRKKRKKKKKRERESKTYKPCVQETMEKNGK